MMKAKVHDLNANLTQKIAGKYKRFIKELIPQMAAIRKFNPKFKIEKKFTNLLKYNFFKYKEFTQVTKVFTEEVSQPFFKQSLEEANITQDKVNDCKQGSCEQEMKDSEIQLIAPMELLKVSSDILTDIGAGHLIKFVLDGQKGLDVNRVKEFKQMASQIMNKLLGSNFDHDILELSKYLSYSFNTIDLKGLILEESAYAMKSIGPLADDGGSNCDPESSKLYSIFWGAYLIREDKMLRYNCTRKSYSCPEITSECFKVEPTAKTCLSVVVEEPPCKDVKMSETFKFKPCCDFVKTFTDNYQASLKLMKYSIQPVHFQESYEEETRVFSNITNVFKDSGFFIKPNGILNRRNFNSFIPLCQYAGKPIEMKFQNCNLFQRSFSNMGLGFSFNGESFWNTFKRNKYNSIFERIMYPKVNKLVQFPESSGPDYSLKFVLNGK